MKTAQELRRAFLHLRNHDSDLRVPSEALRDQPFDALLYRQSILYRRSRKLYLRLGGKFRATLVSSPRTLSSSILLELMIEYTPLAKEYLWAAEDSGQHHAMGDEHLETLRTFVASVFHEQNHRILWSLLPSCPKTPQAARRFLNFAEALVITTDAALADQMGSLARPLYLTGAIYNPGGAKIEFRRNKRLYRNYLQAFLYSTYLLLELYEPKQIEKALSARFTETTHVLDRANQLSLEFIIRTNRIWQKRYRKRVQEVLGGPSSLDLPADPLDTRLLYLWGEKWFDSIGL